MEFEETDQDQDDFGKAFDEGFKPEEKPEAKPQESTPAANESKDDGPKGAADDNGDPDPEPKPDPDPDPEPDPLAKLQAELAQAQHRERSSANRVSHFMRESNQLAERNRALEAEIARLKQATPAPAAPDSDDEELDGVLAEAPDLRASVEKLIAARMAPLNKALEAANNRLAQVGEAAEQVGRRVDPLVSRDEEQQALQVQQALDKSFPQWRDEIQSEPFQAWLPTQPKAIQDLFQNGRTFDEAATVMRLFHADKGAPKAKEPPAEPQGNADAANRLKQAAGIASRAPVHVSTRKDDFDGSFDEFAAQMKR